MVGTVASPGNSPVLQSYQPSFSLDLLSPAEVLDATFTFTRASAGWRFNKNGLYESVTNNLPRFDYDPVTLQPLGLFFEEQRTNALLFSADLTNAAWAKVNMTAAKDATGLDGAANSASTATATGANATVLQTLVLAAAARSYSVYIKRKTGTGVVSITRDGTTWVDVTASISAGAWARVAIENTSVLNPVLGIRLTTNGDAVFVDGNQDEAGEMYTSYIPTAGATVTRAVEVADMSAIGFGGLRLSSDGGTLLCQFATRGGVGSDRVPFFMSDSATNTQFLVIEESFNSAVGIRTGAANVSTVMPATNGLKGAFGFSVEPSSLSINNGFAILGASGGAMPVGINRLRLGQSSFGNGFLSGYLKTLKYWPRRIPRSLLQNL